MLTHLCLDIYCEVYGFLTPLEVAATRSCTRAFHARLTGPDSRRVWAAAARHASLPDILARLPTARAADAFNAIYAVVRCGPPLWWSRWYARHPMRPVRVLQLACEHGWLEKVRWILGRFQIPAKFIHRGADAPLWRAWRNGHTEVVRWLLTTYPSQLLRPSVWSISALRTSCAKGHLDLIQILVAIGPHTTRIPYKDIVQASDVLTVACAHGHLAVARWLVSVFDMRSSINAAALAACHRGHITVVAWLMRATPLNQTTYASLMLSACAAGHLDIARLVHAECNSQSPQMDWLYVACKSGHFTLADWLMSTFDMSSHPVLLTEILLRLVGNLPAVRWLVRWINPADPRYAHLKSPVEIGCSRRRWLRYQFRYAAIP